MIVIVCGGRHFTDGEFVFAELDKIHAARPISLVVEGGQRTFGKNKRPIGGADFHASEWAVLRGIETKRENARWRYLEHPAARIKKDKSGRPYDANAGFRRNGLMIAKYHPEAIIAFDGGVGTGDMVTRALGAGVEVIEVHK